MSLGAKYHLHKKRKYSIREGRPNSDINVTPLVDVVLVLLIIFMVVTPLLEKDISVRVPDDTEQDVQPEDLQDQLVVSIDEAGQIRLNSEALDDELQDADQARPGGQVVRGEAGVLHPRRQGALSPRGADAGLDPQCRGVPPRRRDRAGGGCPSRRCPGPRKRAWRRSGGPRGTRRAPPACGAHGRDEIDAEPRGEVMRPAPGVPGPASRFAG
jgi:biopolymer transport protein ExbD